MVQSWAVRRRGRSPSETRGLSLLVDARGLEQSGIGRYLREVLTRFFHDPRFSSFTLLGPVPQLTEFARRAPGDTRVRIVDFDHGFYSARAQFHWVALSLTGALDADVVFFPHYDAPVWAVSAPSVVVVHDLTHFKLVRENPAWKRAVAGRVLRRAVRRAAHVVVPSRAVEADLVRREPTVASRLSVVYEGVGSEFDGGGDPRPGARGSYLLCVGNRKAYKNHAAAVEVLAGLRAEYPALRLVVVGRSFPESDGVAERAARLGVREAVTELEGVTDAELRELYAGAACFFFPSRFEGFGLPVLEAMAAGVPVVASNRTSIPEVVGDAGVLVDPDDTAAMVSAVRRLLEEPAYRDEMVKRGRERARVFRWERAADATAQVLVDAATRERA